MERLIKRDYYILDRKRRGKVMKKTHEKKVEKKRLEFLKEVTRGTEMSKWQM